MTAVSAGASEAGGCCLGAAESAQLAAGGTRSHIARTAEPGDTAGFADSCALHLISQDSLRDLGDRLGDRRELAVRARFRANLVTEGAAPYAEDRWQQFNIGEVHFRQLGPCARCVIPTTDPVSGLRDDDSEPRATLMKYRSLPYGDGVHGGPTFGLWLGSSEGELRVGQTIDVSVDKEWEMLPPPLRSKL